MPLIWLSGRSKCGNNWGVLWIYPWIWVLSKTTKSVLMTLNIISILTLVLLCTIIHFICAHFLCLRIGSHQVIQTWVASSSRPSKPSRPLNERHCHKTVWWVNFGWWLLLLPCSFCYHCWPGHLAFRLVNIKQWSHVTWQRISGYFNLLAL